MGLRLRPHLGRTPSSSERTFLTEDSRKPSLQSLISECGVLQASVNSFRQATTENGLFTKLKQTSRQTSPGRCTDTEVYRHGKAIIAAKAKARLDQIENEQLKLVKSLLLSEKGNQPYMRAKDLTTKDTSKLLAINRRKFGEPCPTELKLIKPPYCSTLKTPSIGKSLHVLRDTLLKKDEQLTSLNQLIFSRTQKYRPTLSSTSKKNIQRCIAPIGRRAVSLCRTRANSVQRVLQTSRHRTTERPYQEFN
jgi:hypothetical protein